MTRNTLAIEVEGEVIDARALPKLDADLVKAEIEANVTLSSAISVRSDVTIEASSRLEQSVGFFLENEEITTSDAQKVVAVLEAQFKARK